jgi:hypothetical protein
MGQKVAKAQAATKGKTAEFDAGGLPAGIEGGVARLADAKIGEYKDGPNKGQKFFLAAGVALSPAELNGQVVAGGRTQIGPEPLCDTPQSTGKRRTFEDHWAWMINELKCLGCPCEWGDTPQSIEAGLMATLKMLKDTKPTFKFRTWKGAKQTVGPYKDREPRVQHVWGGLCSFSANGDAAALAVDDEAGVEVEESGEAPAEEAEEPAERFDEFGDLDSLVAKATQGDKQAQQQLIEMAVKAGHDRKAAEDTGSWQECGDLCKHPPAAEEEEAGDSVEEEVAEEEVEEFKPKKGQQFGYQVIDKATGKPKKGKDGKKLPPVGVKVVAVDADAETVDITDGKITWKKVKWAKLIQDEDE